MPNDVAVRASSHGTPRLAQSRTHFSRSFSRRVRLLCKAAKRAVSGASARLAVKSLVFAPLTPQQQRFNCKGKIAARGPFSVYTSVRNKATRLDWRRELAAGLQGCCTLCWPARATPRRASLGAKRARCLASLLGTGEHAFYILQKHSGRAHAVTARTRPTETTQIIASSASRCRAFANRVALRRQK